MLTVINSSKGRLIYSLQSIPYNMALLSSAADSATPSTAAKATTTQKNQKKPSEGASSAKPAAPTTTANAKPPLSALNAAKPAPTATATASPSSQPTKSNESGKSKGKAKDKASAPVKSQGTTQSAAVSAAAAAAAARASILNGIEGWKHYAKKTVIDLDESSDAGKFFKVLDKSSATTGETAEVSREEYCGELESLHHAVSAYHIMARKPAFEIINQLKPLQSGNGDINVTITGNRGVGKSITLLHVVEFCRRSGWLVLFAPRPWEWNYITKAYKYGDDFGNSIVSMKPRDAALEANGLKVFGQPKGAQSVLNEFRKAHGDIINKIPQKRKYDHQLYQSATGGSATLGYIVARGLSNLNYASEALYDLRMELSLVDSHPVLIAADQINTLYWPTCFHMKNIRLHPDQLLLLRTFRAYDDNGEIRSNYRLKRGAIISATSEKYTAPLNEKKDITVTPFKVAGSSKSSSSVIEVPAYSADELTNVLQYYSLANIISDKKAVYDKNNILVHGLHTGFAGDRVLKRAASQLQL